MKSYRQVLLSKVPEGQRKTRDLVFFHRVHTLSALIQKLEGGQLEPPKPVIVVTTEGAGLSTVFLVKGSGFLVGNAVTVRVARIGEGQIHTGFFHTQATSDGKIEMRISIPCVSGLEFSFSANDGRSDASDLTGTLWSNTFPVTCR